MSKEQLKLRDYLHAALVPLIPIGVGFVLLLFFKLELAESLPVILRILLVVVGWIVFCIASNFALEAPERRRNLEAIERANVVRANQKAQPSTAASAFTEKPIRPVF